MKKTERKIMIVLTLTLAVLLAMSTFSFAETNTVDGGKYVFDGDTISTDGSGSISETISNMEPGDSVTINLTYTNDTDDTTDWYMKSDVIKTLEDSSTATGGGYTFILTNVGPGGQRTEIFNSDAVGGDDTEAGIGLHQAEDATEDWFFIQELKGKKSGNTELYVALEGESQANVYQGTDANIDITYAVEVQTEGEDIYRHVGTKTGDNTSILLPLVVFLTALLLLAIGIISYRKDRKGGARNEN